MSLIENAQYAFVFSAGLSEREKRLLDALLATAASAIQKVSGETDATVLARDALSFLDSTFARLATDFGVTLSEDAKLYLSARGRKA